MAPALIIPTWMGGSETQPPNETVWSTPLTQNYNSNTSDAKSNTEQFKLFPVCEHPPTQGTFIPMHCSLHSVRGPAMAEAPSDCGEHEASAAPSA